jgi:hypothetical protein
VNTQTGKSKYRQAPLHEPLRARLPGAQLIFQNGERAGKSDNGERRDDTDSRDVRPSKHAVSNPLAIRRSAHPDSDQSADDEKHDQRVQHENRVGKPDHFQVALRFPL